METLQESNKSLKVSLNYDNECSQSLVTESDDELVKNDYEITSGQHKVNKCYLVML